MLNKQITMGRLTADPELRATPSGKMVCSFCIASDEDIRREDGTRDTDFVNCIAWNQTAEFVSKYFTKGSQALVVGRPKTRNFTDSNGNKREKTEVRVENVYFGGSNNRNENNTQKNGTNQSTPATPPTFEELSTNDDLPF